MKAFLIGFGWLSAIGSIFDGAIAAWLLVLALAQGADPGLSVDAHLRAHLPFLYWIRALAEIILPTGFVGWLFALPALVYFPVRSLMSAVLGAIALRLAARL